MRGEVWRIVGRGWLERCLERKFEGGFGGSFCAGFGRAFGRLFGVGFREGVGGIRGRGVGGEEAIRKDL